MTPSPFILLHPDDNVLVCRAHVEKGQVIVLDGRDITLSSDIDVGHKIARRDLKAGDKVIKYGAPIGSMTDFAAAAGHVHMHNMKSDYIQSHTREASAAESDSQ